jgi:Protein of unknown function (DUF3226)
VTTANAPSPLTGEFLAVGEGSGDAFFINHLCQVRDIPGFEVEDVRGGTKFITHLKGLKARRGYEHLKGILIVSDNDESPDENFKKIRNYLKDAKLPYPDRVLTVAKRDGLGVAVMMLPYTAGVPSRGCLDTLLLKSVEDQKRDLKICVDAYRTCMAANRTGNQEDKFKLRCFIAAMHADDPNLALSFALSPSKGLIDLSHSSFDEIEAFLRGFPALCEARRA